MGGWACVRACVCVVTSWSSLAHLICVSPAHDPPNEEHSRRLVTVQFILTFVGKCVYSSAIYDVLGGKRFHRGGRKKVSRHPGICVFRGSEF